MIRRWIALAAAGAALIAAAPASAGTQAVTIEKVDLSNFPTVAVTVNTPTGASKQALQVTENGKPVRGLSQDRRGGTSIALLIDVSKSMAGQQFTDAVDAAGSFVASQPAETSIGLYGFGSTAFVAAPMSNDRTQVDSGLGQLAADTNGGTALYGAIRLASHDLSSTSSGRRVIVLLTDGASSHEADTIDQAIADAQDDHVSVYAIGVGTTGMAAAALDQIATATDGSYSPVTSSAELQSMYSQVSQALGETSTLTYQSQSLSGHPIQIVVTGTGLQAASKTVTAPGTVTAASKGGAIPGGLLGRIVPGAVAAVLVLLAALVMLSSKGGFGLQKRIAPYTGERRAAEAVAAAQHDPTRLSLMHQLFIATEKVIGSMNWWKRSAMILEQADLPLRTAELFYIQVGAGLFLATIAAFLFSHGGIFALVALVIGATIPWLFVKFKAGQRLGRFENQLPETLITMAASLKAGHAFNQAVQSAVNEGAEPSAKEFGRVLAEIQLGAPSEQALEAMAKRMHSYNFGFVVMAVNIQRTVGGSLADILDMVADTVRQRQQFEKKVKALTAQGRMSAYVLLAMPFLMALAIFVINPAYMSILWTESMGKMMIAFGCVSMFIGSLIIKKIVSFKG